MSQKPMISGLFVFIAFLLVSPCSGLAAEVMVGFLGAEYRSELNVEGDYEDHYFSVLSVGGKLSSHPYWILVESLRYNEGSSVGNLSVSRSVENYLLWTYREQPLNRILNSFFGVGLGLGRETVETTFMGESSVDLGRWKFASSGAVGLRAQIRLLWLSMEARLNLSENHDPNPFFTAVGRLGLYF